MAEVSGASTWREELASLVEETGIIYTGETISVSSLPLFDTAKSTPTVVESVREMQPPESLKQQAMEFLKSWCEMLLELGRGCRDIWQQTVVTEDSFIVRKLGEPVSKVSCRLRFLNEFLPEDRDPIHAWPVIFFVFILALSALNLSSGQDRSVLPVKKDEILTEGTTFEHFWHRDVEESIRQGNTKPFIEEAVLQVSSWGFSLADLQLQKKCYRSGIFPRLMSLYSPAECELVGFLGPIHIWQGMDDQAAPSAMTDHISRVLPEAIIHRLPKEGHFSYLFFCDECQRQIFSTLFGNPQGPLDEVMDEGEIPSEGGYRGEKSLATDSTNK